MTYITFNDTTSEEMGVYWHSADRTLLPMRRVIRYEVPGRDGYYEYGLEGSFDNRVIIGTISFMGDNRDLPTLREKARKVAHWLSNSAPLVFSDEPDKYYWAKVIDAVPFEQLARTGRCMVAFDCRPFAESINLSEHTAEITLPHTETVTVDGTQDTPCIIHITAKSNITSITIERKANS